MIEAALVLALAAPAADRWPDCTITATATTRTGAPFRRAVRDIHRAAGIHIVVVPSGGQVTIREAVPGDPLVAWAYAGALSAGEPHYTAGTVLVRTRYIRPLPARWERSLWQHELGHILGLGHDGNPNEVMAFGLRGRLSTPGWVTGLRERYPECKES